MSIEDFEKEVAIYQFRKDNSSHIVGILSVNELKQEMLCSSTTPLLVVTERIPFRLSDLGNLNYVEALYIL